MINVQRLKVFREVAAKGSFSGAADSLSYTQSAVSQAVARLEAEAGVKLIERDRRGARPTVAGEALLAHADGIMASLDAAETELATLAGVKGGHLRMASFPTAGATLMPPAIASFREAYPEVELSLAEGEPDEIVPRMRAGEFDLALLFEFEGADLKLGGTLRRTELFEDPMQLALPRDHLLASKRRLKLEDLSGESWIQTEASSPCARHVLRSCHAAGFEPNISFESDDYMTVVGLVAAEVGVALIPRLALAGVSDEIAVRDLYPRSPVRSVVAATPRGRSMTAAAATMLDVLGGTTRRYVTPKLRR